MDDLGVWEKIKRKDKPDDRQYVKNHWAFEIKRNGVFSVRLVTCGYTHIPGIDFTECNEGISAEYRYVESRPASRKGPTKRTGHVQQSG